MNESCLVIGCGNSAFSSDLYDHGFKNITNIDFSEQVINSMKLQNIQRNLMKWEVMDMTAMTYSDESYDAILDKGALDALMSANTIEAKNQAINMFDCIHRVLKPNGRYICITLAEDFIVEQLLSHFSETMHYQTQIHTIQSDSPSPFKTFVMIFTKGSPNHSIEVFFDTFGAPLPNQQKLQLSLPDTLDRVYQVQLFSQKRFDMSVVKPGSRFEVVDIFSATAHPTIPRFSIIVYDFAKRAARSCAVFFVPSGREMEYQFSTPGGLATIAEQAGCRRLLAVRCNKPHEFPAMPELQDELTSVALSLAPGDIGDISNEDRIPYVALEDNSAWDTIESGTLEQVGLYCVEESSTEECKRRLIFLQNQQFVQTEVRLNVSLGGQRQNQKKGKKKKGTPQTDQMMDQPIFQFDYTYLDDHHRAMLVAYLGTNLELVKECYRPRPRTLGSESSEQRLPLLSSLHLENDPCEPWLSLEYLQHLSSKSLPCPPGDGIAPAPELTQMGPRTLLIGLGGGSLAMALQKYFPFMSLDIIELVPGLEDIAVRNFGFIKGHRTRVLVGDGLQVINSMIHHNEHTPFFRYDCIIIDVDSKDTSQGLSAPPKDFITPNMIHSYHSLLSPNGLLSINVVARDQSLFYQLSNVLCHEFNSTQNSIAMGNVYRIISSSENVNVTLHATSYGPTLQTPSPDNSKNKKKKGNTTTPLSPYKLSEKNKRKELEDWLKAISLSSDPLGLEDLIDKIDYLTGLGVESMK